MSHSSRALEGPPEIETHTLSGLRTHIQALSSSTQKLSAEITTTGPATPLPSYTSMIDSLNFTNYHIQQLSAYLSRNRIFLNAAHMHPLPTFPVQQDGLLAQLVRKGEQDNVTGSIERALALLEGKCKDEPLYKEYSGPVGTPDLGELPKLWRFAEKQSLEEIKRVPRGLDYTIEEAVNGTEKVQTGLRRKLFAGSFADYVEDGGSDVGSDFGSEELSGDEDEHSPMDIDSQAQRKERDADEEAAAPVLPPMQLDDILRFMTTGQLQSKGTLRMR